MGDVSWKIRQMPSTHSIGMVPLLPIPITNRNIPQKWLDEQLRRNGEVLNEVLRLQLHPLTFHQNPSAGRGYYNVLSADVNFGHCKPVFAAWRADCPECSDLHHHECHGSS